MFIFLAFLFSGATAYNFKADIKKFDQYLCKGCIEDLYGVVRGEDWGIIKNNHREFFSASFIEIAHGGGYRNDPNENTKIAFDSSRSFGIRFFELDLAVTNGRLLCENSPSKSEQGGCDIEKIIGALDEDEYLFLDAKSNLSPVLEILSKTRFIGSFGKNVIVQLYRPSDLVVFNRYKNYFGFFIFSLYKSNRSIAHICSNFERAGLKSLVIGASKLSIGTSDCSGQYFVVHPVKTCERLEKFRQHPQVMGAMVSADGLKCGKNS